MFQQTCPSLHTVIKNYFHLSKMLCLIQNVYEIKFFLAVITLKYYRRLHIMTFLKIDWIKKCIFKSCLFFQVWCSISKPWPNLERPNLERPNLERLNVERPNLERPNLEWLNLEWDRTSNDRSSKVTEPQMTKPQKGPNLELDRTSNDRTSKDRTSNEIEPRKWSKKFNLINLMSVD